GPRRTSATVPSSSARTPNDDTPRPGVRTEPGGLAMNGDTYRLIDLHVDWLLQYAHETSLFDPTYYPDIPQRLGQIEGYLHATGAAILACYRHADDWARQPDLGRRSPTWSRGSRRSSPDGC